MDEYQHNFSKINLAVSDIDSRTPKFKKMQSIINDYSHSTGLENAVCLEVGCSAGIITNMLAQHLGTVVGIDIDHNAIHSANNIINGNASLLVGDALKLPFKDKSIDVVICNHIYEHVPNSHILMSEIYRVLKDDGLCYFAAGNKYNIIEAHYHLPFLSWLPKPIANLYLRITGKGQKYYEKHLSYFGLCNLLKDFEIHDYTLKIMHDPKKFMATDMITENSFITKTSKFVFRIFQFFIPTYIY